MADASIERFERIRPAFAESVLDESNTVHDLNQRLQTLASEQAEVVLWKQWKQIVASGKSEATATAIMVRQVMTMMIINGADDRWSGRGNDLRRAEFDGRRFWLDRVDAGSFIDIPGE